MGELERRLRELTDKLCALRNEVVGAYDHEWVDLHDFAIAAASIGAEVEREACIDVVATSGDQFASVVGQAEVQKRIRALSASLGGKP